MRLTGRLPTFEEMGMINDLNQKLSEIMIPVEDVNLINTINQVRNSVETIRDHDLLLKYNKEQI